ncbi:hypothetical protein [Streptomyces sp. NPDC048508]|uniref:hypothetical protein n=1 Tax=Streptomyces sp. NPDC048508 TaxID=3365561 RepID=UPI00371FE240
MAINLGGQMPRVPMPSPDRLPPGSHRDLLEAIHLLHQEAGWPGLQKTSLAIRERDDLHDTISHQGIGKILRGETLPVQWLKLEALVRQYLSWNTARRDRIDAEVLRIQELWQRAVASRSGWELPVPDVNGEWPSPERLVWLVNELDAAHRSQEADELLQRAIDRGPEEWVRVLAALCATDPEFVKRALHDLGSGAQDLDQLVPFLDALHRVPSEAWRGEDPFASLMKGTLLKWGSGKELLALVKRLRDHKDQRAIHGLMRAVALKWDPFNTVELIVTLKRLRGSGEVIDEFLKTLVADMDAPLVQRTVQELRSRRSTTPEADSLDRLLTESFANTAAKPKEVR